MEDFFIEENREASLKGTYSVNLIQPPVLHNLFSKEKTKRLTHDSTTWEKENVSINCYVGEGDPCIRLVGPFIEEKSNRYTRKFGALRFMRLCIDLEYFSEVKRYRCKELLMVPLPSF